MAKPLPRVGVDKLYYAKVLSDTEEGTIYGAPVWLQGVNTIGYNPGTQRQTYAADDGTYVSFSAPGEIQVSLQVANLLPATRADLLGLRITSTGMVIEGEANNAPEVAIGFRSQKTNGAYTFVWVLKGKFSEDQSDYTTKGPGGITIQPKNITMIAQPRESDGNYKNEQESDADGLNLTLAQLSSATDGWFSSPNFDASQYTAGTAISDLTAATGSNAGEITVAFTAAAGASNVAVQVSKGSEWATMANLTASDSSATIPGLVPDANYLVRLYVTGGTNAGVSNVVSAKAGAGA